MAGSTAPERRVVVTGMGAVTPLGNSLAEYWAGLTSGRSGVGLITGFDCSAISTRIAAQVVGFEPAEFMDADDARTLDRFAQFAVAAARMAQRDADLGIEEAERDRVGVFLGSGIGGIGTFEREHARLREQGPDAVSAALFSQMLPGMSAGRVAMMLGARGPSHCVVTACATSTNAIGDGFLAVRRGAADVVFAGGSEAAVTPSAMAGFSNMRALSRRNDDPRTASRPFDAGRDGFVLGEGGAVLVLEELSHAARRGARIDAEIIGYGMSNDAYDMVHPAPDGGGAARAMTAALRRAGLAPEAVGYINAHATGTPAGDVLEVRAIKSVFGSHAGRLAVSSTKSMTGHLGGAAGAIEAVATVLALRTGILPPTINLHEPAEGCDLDFVPHRARHQPVDFALSNSFGFGGHNAILVFRRWAR